MHYPEPRKTDTTAAVNASDEQAKEDPKHVGDGTKKKADEDAKK